MVVAQLSGQYGLVFFYKFIVHSDSALRKHDMSIRDGKIGKFQLMQIVLT